MVEQFFKYISSIKIPLTAAIAVYAAIVSTFMAGVKIYEIVDAKRIRVRLRARVGSQVIIYNNGSFGPWISTYIVNIYNPGKLKNRIDHPQIQLRKAIGRGTEFASLLDVHDVQKNFRTSTAPTKFPHVLGPNDSIDFVLPASSINEVFIERKTKSFRFVITDNLGNTFKSNKIKPAGFNEPPWQPT
jgi:hypothetical protein